MQIIRFGEKLASAVDAARAAGTLAFVPTMGALHAGHIALVEEAKKRADQVIVSIFVNPTQFGPNEDFSRYPRKEQEDTAMLEAAGCDIAWLPGVEDIYPPGFATTVSVKGISERWEGEARPGHFDGVATVVARLFGLVEPDVAIFGEKDFQQLAVIRQMTADLALGTEIVGLPTVRDRDGLALSSRNTYLSKDGRALALALPRALAEARDSIRSGIPAARALATAKQRLLDGGFLKVDYVALVDGDSLEPIETADNGRLIAAATIGKTRLIDNIAV